VNLDFADIRTVMAEMGKAMMGTGEADGDNRAIRAAEAAINNPLLEDTSMSGARGLLINITGGDDMTLFEVDLAANRIREEVDEDANIIFGSAIDESLSGRVRVSVIATGIDRPAAVEQQRPRLVAVGGGGVMAVGTQTDAPGPGAPAAAAHPPAGFVPAGYPPGQGTGNPAPGAHPSRSAPSAEGPAVAFRPSIPQHSGPPHAGAAESEHAGYAVAEAASGRPPHAPRPRPGLFAAPRAPESIPPAEPARSSLFGTVTGVFRRRAPGGPAASAGEVGEAVRQDPALAPSRSSLPHEPRSDPARASIRPVAGDEVGLEIPTFLRRQQS
ncbi:MAG: cell division protein FtsZ, partial [Rhodospirillales bacterium]|nr:cell division protein FtsZ [Rhodospirillales bacterium]